MMLARRTIQMMVVIGMTVSAWIPAMAGSAAIGSLAGTQNATLDSVAALPNTTIFSGDRLSVSDGVAVVTLARGNRMVFGSQTQASFVTEAKGVTVLLAGGTVLLYHEAGEQSMRLKVDNVTVSPVAGFKTLGEVAMLNGFLVVTAKHGELQLETSGKTEQIAEGKTVTLSPKTAQAPSQGSASPNVKNSASKVQWVELAASATGAVLAGVGISRADTANHAAAAANSEATLAASNASAATSAANAAINAANAAQQTANSLGCGLNKIGGALGMTSSPYTPPAGSTCP